MIFKLDLVYGDLFKKFYLWLTMLRSKKEFWKNRDRNIKKILRILNLANNPNKQKKQNLKQNNPSIL